MPLSPHFRNSAWMGTPEYVFEMDSVRKVPVISSTDEHQFDAASISTFPRIVYFNPPRLTGRLKGGMGGGAGGQPPKKCAENPHKIKRNSSKFRQSIDSICYSKNQTKKMAGVPPCISNFSGS